jgi:glutathione peroxidase
VKWNFTKFLIDRNGEIVARFEPTAMKKLKNAIEEVL